MQIKEKQVETQRLTEHLDHEQQKLDSARKKFLEDRDRFNREMNFEKQRLIELNEHREGTRRDKRKLDSQVELLNDKLRELDRKDKQV